MASVSSFQSGPLETTTRNRSHVGKTLLTLRGGEDDIKTQQEETLIKFYTLKGGTCPYAARTWITLLELGIPFETIEISKEDKDNWYLDINPRGKVPALVNTKDGSVVYESAICDEYLSDLARDLGGGPSLMPDNPSERASLRLLNDHVDNSLSPAQFTLLMNKDEEKDKELIEKLEKALGFLEESLDAHGGSYLMGKDFSLADVHVLPFFLRMTITLDHYKGYKLSKENFPNLLRWFDICSQKESVKPSAKSREEIIEVYDRFIKADYAFGGLNKNKK
ncbi:unnamed protein product [Cylindrotheca closterium]|uniref:Glutathione transferase n=1 Tax=Cylindrotheca closterium TaxID=2856 RepID=A0AAD2PUI1_9STRA|nr:unnamed protein product [Cylindrotheca closterium]